MVKWIVVQWLVKINPSSIGTAHTMPTIIDYKRFQARLALTLLILLVVCSCSSLFAQQTSAKDEIRAGIVAYQFSNYSSAAEHFEAALKLDPGSMEARLGLATSYAQQYIPGDESAANVELATQAVAEFKDVLRAAQAISSAIEVWSPSLP